MADQSHRYENTVEWIEQFRGTLNAAPRAQISIGAPTEFGGSDDVWSPEQLCVAAVNACVMMTFITIARNSRVAFRHYASSATGTLEKGDGGGYVITRIRVKPHVTIGPDVARAKVDRLIKMAEKHCYISNSLKAEVTVEAEIEVAA